MERISCDVVGDLLPLYCDGVCSEDSRKIVEDHLQDCPKCSGLLQKMRTEYRLSSEEEQKQEEIVKDMASKWRHSVKKSFCTGVLITVCTCLILMGGYWALTRLILVPVPLATTEAAVQNVSDEHVTISLRVTDGNKVISASTKITEDGRCYILLQRGVIPIDNGGGEIWDNEWSVARMRSTDSGERVSVREIYCGTEDDCILIWRAE